MATGKPVWAVISANPVGLVTLISGHAGDVCPATDTAYQRKFTPLAEKARPYFQKLRELKIECESVLGATLPHLSMGMSGDFEVAIEEGATLVRIGTALFGERLSSLRRPAEAN